LWLRLWNGRTSGDVVDVWAEPLLVPLRAPLLFNLRMDPFERAPEEAIGYHQWWAERLFAFVPAQAFVA
jgi:arylsulfatase